MKRSNNNNIIFDHDIIATTNDNVGTTLDNVLSGHEARIHGLESNTKWLYKYGGMGSGGGGGGGSTTAWKTVFTCVDLGGLILKDGSNINFSSIGRYSFKIQIYNGGTSSYKLTWTYRNSGGNQSISDIVTSNDSFSITKKFDFDLNGSLNLTVLNQDTFEVVTYSVTYVVVPYNFNMYFVYADNKAIFLPYENGDIFMSDVKTRGLQVALDYSVNVDLDKSIYTYTNWSGSTITVNREELEPGQQAIESNSSKVIYLNLVDGDIIQFLSDNDNAAYLEFNLDITIKLHGRETVEVIPRLQLQNNLIPSDMYLKVKTLGGEIKLTKPPLYPKPTSYSKQFSIGVAVFNLTPTFGPTDKSRIYTLQIKYGTSPDDAVPISTGITQLIDSTEQAVKIQITESGIHFIQFSITYAGTTFNCCYYLSVSEMSDKFSWYPTDPLVEQTKTAYYRKIIEAKNIFINSKELQKTDSLDMTINSADKILTIYDSQTLIETVTGHDQMICVGMQYSVINDTETPILSFNTADGKGSIYIYQNKIVVTTAKGSITGNSIDIFFDMQESYDPAANTKYHLIQVYKRFESVSGDNTYKSISIYIDGILEASFKTFDNLHYDFNTIHMYAGNYSINLLEYSCFKHIAGSTIETRSYLTDTDVLGYYYSYVEKVLGIDVEDSDRLIFNQISRFTYTDDNYIKCTDTEIASLAQIANSPPILVVKFTDNNGKINELIKGYDKDNFKEWMEKSYKENDTIETLNVTLQWSAGNGEELHDIKIDGSEANFQTTIQGSSTRSYRCKNFELFAPVSSEKDYVFTPNFKQNDPMTFLPESSFTLKADVVDSSHSNNNAMGDFINANTTKFAGAKQSGNIYSNHIKNCLTGFPIMLFLHTAFKSSEKSGINRHNYYYLGIYNFNLGRGSYFNLGYKDLNILNKMNISDGFGIYEIDSTENKLLEGMRVAEIQGNSAYFDFSQYDSTILFQLPNFSNDTNYMFGDFIDGKDGTYYTNVKQALANIVMMTSLAGGYVFKTIGKLFGMTADKKYGYDEGYSAVDSSGASKNQVPNYTCHATRSKDGVEDVYTFTTGHQEGTESDVKSLVIGDPTASPQVPAAIDYTALVEYYTACMAFGLVDSVQKNFNLKSWNNGTTFYPAFYDMDTCLGIANDGSKIHYYAFSDYWLSKNEESKLLPVTIYRDFSPTSDGGTEHKGMYDSPSSYLFAIAKYAYIVLRETELENNPNTLWAQWRASASKGGCLSDAQAFIDNYYANHLHTIPLAAFNCNYRYKYLVQTESKTSYDDINFNKFWGRKIAYTKNWINSRLHILDAYFNMNSISEQLTEDIEAPIPKIVDNDNKDIYVLHDIFSSEASGNQYNMKKNVLIRALPASPIVLVTPTIRNRYLTPEKQIEMQLTLATTGTQHLLIGGSALWTYVNTIDPFISEGKLRLVSDYFTTIYGTNGTCHDWTDIKVPSIREVTLISKNYSGELKFDNTNPNLQKVNINNSAIKLEISGSDLNTINATNMQSGAEVKVTNTYTLTNVSLNGEFETLTIPAWKQKIYLPTNYPQDAQAVLNCNTITITNDPIKFPNNELYIRNNSKLTTLDVKGFSTISISGCPNLTRIYINDANKDILQSFSVQYASGASHQLTVSSTSTTAENVIDLSDQTKLTDIVIQNSAIVEVKIGQGCQVKLNAYAFSGCNKLQYLTNLNNSKFLINGNSVFHNCNLFNLKQSNKTRTAITLSEDVTSLDNMFYISTGNKGAMTLKDAKYFLDNCCSTYRDNITSISNLFRNQSITYNLNTTTAIEYTLKTCSLDFNFKNCTTANYILYSTYVHFWNRYMLKNLGKNVETLSISQILYPNAQTEAEKDINYVHTTEDFLYEVLLKLSTLELQYHSMIMYSIVSSGNSTTYSELSEVSLHKIFHSSETIPTVYPKKLTTVSGIQIINDLVDGTDMFSEYWEKANDVGLTISTIAYHSKMKFKAGTLDNFFQNIKLKSVTASFYNVEYKDDSRNDVYLDLDEFIDWDNIEQVTNLFYSSSSYPSLQFKKKKMSLNKFHHAWDKIILARQLTAIEYLFQNTMVIADIFTDEDAFFLNSDSFRADSKNLPNTSITHIPYVFDGMFITTDNGKTKHYISLNHSFLKYMPNLTNLYRTFSNFALYHTLPYDFFNKRKEITTTGIYINRATIDPETEMETIERVPGTLHTFEYTKNLTNLYYCFADIECHTNFCGFDPTAAYNENCIISDYIVYNDTGARPEERFNYYYIGSSTQAKQLSICTEITDCEVSTDYTNTIQMPDTIQDASKKAATLYNYQINKELTKNKLFVAPDILYGIKDGSTLIDGLFSNNRIDPTTGAIQINTFVGALPKNIFKTVDYISFTNVFQNLNILPQKYNSMTETVESINIKHDYFTFVPNGFTECLNLNYAFNFRIFLPPHKKVDSKNHYCILRNNSISYNTESMRYSLPSVGYSGLYVDRSTIDFAYKFANYDHELHYSIMDTEIFDSVTKAFVGVESGIDLDKFPSLMLDFLVQPYLIRILSEHIFNQDTWTATGLLSKMSNKDNYVIDIGASGLFSRAVTNLFPVNNDCFIRNYTNGWPSVNKKSAINYDQIQTAKYNVSWVD